MEISLDSKSSLSRMWLAAHWERKLTKSQITSHDIKESVSAMINPSETLALRVTGHLLLGLVKIVSKKAAFLLGELEETLEQLQQGFKTNAAELLKAAGITALPKDITMSARKPPPALDSYDDPLSLITSQRSSVERPRYIADRAQITMSESETTPLAARYTLKAMRESQFGTSQSFLDDVENSREANNQMSLFEVTPAEMDIEPERFSPEPSTPIPANDLQVAMDLEPVPHRESEAPSVRPPLNADENRPEVRRPRPVAKRRKPKNEWREDDTELIENYDDQADLEHTSDLVRNPNFFAPSSVKVPVDQDSIFYSALVKGLSPELQNFYTSHIKLLRLKNALQEQDAPPQEYIDQDTYMPEPDVFPEAKGFSPDRHEEEPVVEVQMQEEQEPVLKEEVEWHEQWSGRTVKMLNLLQAKLAEQPQLNFNELSQVNDRKTTACGFYELLVLNCKGYIVMEQQASFSDIEVSSTSLLFQS
jgi:cohesin complex subunit SCC1